MVPSTPTAGKVSVQKVLIIRFGALGDLCLLAWSLSRWARGDGAENRHVTLVTKATFAPLMKRMHGIDEVISLPAGGGQAALWNLAKELKALCFDTIVDAHSILRSHTLLLMMNRNAKSRLKKDTLKRLLLLGGARADQSLDRTMVQRFDAVLAPLGPLAGSDSPPPLTTLAPEKTHLGLAPGAQWDSKRWPEEKFSHVLQLWAEQSNTPVRIFLGPQEERWFQGSQLEQAVNHVSMVQVIRNTSLLEVAESLAQCQRLLCNDSGLLHIAEAVGTPVLAFFGPTVRQFGYFPRLAESQVLETELHCRPCSRNGKKVCHRGDLACLDRISPEVALQYLLRSTGTRESSP